MEEQDIDSTRSFGDGIERKVMCAMLEMFCRDGAQWFNIRADGHCALSTSHTLSSAQFVSTERKKNMAVLGAAIALCLIRGMSTTPLDPIISLYMIAISTQYILKF